MARKRKLSAKDSTPRKRTKEAHPHGDFDEDREYKIQAILDETRTHYQIEWEDDEITGEKYAPTWEPKHFANKAAVKDWEETKKQKRAAAKGVARKTAVRGGKDRPRKVIDSSPPPEGPSVHPNGETSQTEAPQEEPLEIGESQQTVGGAEDDSAAGSPLFVPLDSPKPHRARADQQPSVQISDPPSSYAAGGYQAFSSSQVPDSAAPGQRQVLGPAEPPSSQVQQDTGSQEQTTTSGASDPIAQPDQTELQEEGLSARNKSPEPSQWKPEQEDTSRTTNETAGLSAALTSSSEPTRSVPVNFEGHPNKIVPDSQSQPDSLSFAPSGTETLSSSAPEQRGRGRPPKEVTAVSGLTQTQEQGEEQSSWQGFSSQPAGLLQSTAPIAASANQQQDEAASQTSAGTPLDGSLQSPHQGVDSGSTKSGTSQARISAEQAQTESQAPSFQKSGSASSQARKERSQALPYASAPQSAGFVAFGPPATISEGSASAPSPSTTPSQSASAAYQTDSENQSLRNGSQHGQDNDDLDLDIRDTTERPESRHSDLTTDSQLPVGQASSITVTPLPPRHTIAAQRNATNSIPAQAFSSFFPFQTQVPGQRSSTASGAVTHSQSAGFQSQAPLQSPSKTPNFGAVPSQGSVLPPALSSPVRTSSPLAPGPSQSLGTNAFAGGAPPRPETPSSPTRPSPSPSSRMDGSQSSPAVSQAREKLRAMRARYRPAHDAERNNQPTSAPASSAVEASPPRPSLPPHVTAEISAPGPSPAKLASPLLRAQDGARSPSVVPAMKALPEITTEEMNTSERYPTLLPQATIPEDDETQRNGSLAGRATPAQQPTEGEDPEAASTHDVPISLVGHQRDQYPQMVYYHQSLIDKFLTTRAPDEDIVSKVERFVERMRAITLHPDLDNPETFTQYDIEPSEKAFWDVNCSAKFRFLKTFLTALREKDTHIVIMLQNTGLLNVLRTFLQGIDVPFTSPGSSTTSGNNSVENSAKLRISILTQDNTENETSQLDLIIDLDNTCQSDDPEMRRMRQKNGKWCPFVSLVVPRSIEHIENHLSRSLSARARLRALVSGINQLKSEAGRLEQGQLDPTEAANALANYLTHNEDDRSWPLVGLSTLEDLDSQTESEIDPPEDAASPAAGAKRQRTDSEVNPNAADLHKRARMTEESPTSMPTTVNLQDVEITRVSDSVSNPTQQAAVDPSDPVQTATERQLQALLKAAQARADDLHSALGDLQYRHEDARTLLIHTTGERDQARDTAEKAITQMSERMNKESSLRNERSELKNKLEEVQTALLQHSVPERAELETLKQALEQAKKEKDVMERRLESARKDADFFRAQFQDASSAAERGMNENRELTNQVAVLTNRASGEQVRLRQMDYDTRTKQLEDENKKLKAVLRDREAGLKFRDEEIAKLKEASRGRMGTRGTSVPRSPMGSRQGSPAVGELRVAGPGRGSLLHPLRNNA